jgi:hypothetical protein
MNTEIITAIISISAAVIVAGASDWFTKKRNAMLNCVKKNWCTINSFGGAAGI